MKTKKKTRFFAIFQGILVFQRLAKSLTDYSLVSKRPKKMQKTFLRKKGLTKTFYDRRLELFEANCKKKLIF